MVIRGSLLYDMKSKRGRSDTRRGKGEGREGRIRYHAVYGHTEQQRMETFQLNFENLG